MKELFLNNLGLKILSLCLSMTLWFFISAKGVSEITLEVPIEYINIPAGYEIVKKDRDTVRVSLFGSEGVLRSIKPEDLRVYVDLKDAPSRGGAYRIKKRDIKVPPALTVSNVSPSRVNIVLDRTVRKRVAVRPDISGKPAAGMVVSRVVVDPPDVELEGPESMVKKISYVRTEPIDIEGLTKDVVRKVHVTSDTGAVRLVSDRVEVQIFIEKGKRK